MRRFGYINKLDLSFLFFLSFIIVLASGVLKQSVAVSMIMFMLLFFLLFLLYSFWYLVYKYFLYFYKRWLKDKLNDFRKAKEKIQSE